ncbi:MAG: tetratricopeptide repeat protein, partial [Myxococcales bacterium]|nr:tetratricopeptide repeat protein [Myxococcales bacterium]
PPSAAIARASSAPQARHAALQPPPPPAYEPTPSPEILDADQLDFEEVDAYEGSAYDPHRKPTGQAPALMAPETLAPEMLAPESFDEPLQQAATAADELYSSGPQQRYDSQSGYAPDGHDHGSGYEASYQSHPSQAHPGQAHPGQHAPPEYVGYEGEEEDLEDEVARVLTEADVYIKYGLHDKAIDHLRQIFERDPANVEVRLKLRDLHLQLGRFADASTELYALAQGLAQTDRRSAAGYLNEALELDQNNVPARELLGMLESGLQPVVDLPLGPSRTHAGGYREDSGLDEFDENSAINLDAGDIVEEIALEPDQDFGSTAVGGPSMLRNPSPGSSAYRGSGDFSRGSGDFSRGSGDFARGSGDFSRGSGEFARGSGELARGSGEFARGSGELSRTPSGELDQLADLAQASSPHGYREDPYGVRESGVLELSGQATDTLGGSMPSQDVIPLPAEQHPSASHARIRQEEEAGSGIEDDLEEADFFIQQHLFAEARSILDDLESRYPGHPLVAAKVADLQESERRADSFNDGTIPGDSQVDLAAELADSLDEPVPPLPGTNEGADYSVEDVFNEFKRGVDNQVSDEDSDTHYDLGIAYREMGLLDDAIAEFKVAMRSREKEVLCHMMIGLCYAEKSMMSEAISQFKTGLYVEGITERETIALYFELGQAYEHLDDLREALYYYEKVGKKDPKFRDVATRIERIRRLSGGGNGAPGGGGSGGAGSSGGGHSARSSRQYHDSDVVELADEHTPATV